VNQHLISKSHPRDGSSAPGAGFGVLDDGGRFSEQVDPGRLIEF